MLNRFIVLLVKSTSETLKCLMFFILFIAASEVEYTGKHDIMLIELSGIMFYLLVTASMKFINRNVERKKVVFFALTSISFIFSLIFIKNLKFEYIILSSFYLFAVMVYAVIHYNYDLDELDIFARKYMVSTLICITNMICLQSSKFIEVVKFYFPIYMIVSILYIIQLNILRQYTDSSANAIDEDKNISMFNIISVITVGVSILIFTTGYLKKMWDFLIFITPKLIYIVLKQVSIIIAWIYENIFYKLYVYRFMKKLCESNEVVDTVMLCCSTILFTSFIIVSIYFMLKFRYKTKNKTRKVNFIEMIKSILLFTSDNPGEHIKLKMKKIKNLHIIRKLYIDTVKILDRKGIEYNNLYTPNEFNEVIENSEFKDKNISHIVRLYNELRYGNKDISKEDIVFAHKVKKNL